MTDQTPVERAIKKAKSPDVFRLFARYCVTEAFESIDTDQLWETIQYAQQNGDDPALAVKNWLTGKDNQ